MFSRKSSAAAVTKVPQKSGAAKGPSSVSLDQPSPPPSEATQKRDDQDKRQSLAFSQIISLMMQSPVYRHFTLADMEWLVIPALATGMYVVGEVKPQAEGPAIPGAAVLWARLSPEIDARLSGNLAAPIRLRPDEWRSGDQLWIIAAIGDQRVISMLLQQLSTSAFEGRQVKIRVATGDGKMALRTLDEVFAVKTDVAA
jgi:cytolysin-activating lysine-acyltransferase